jgi:hypothetical protein
MAIVVDAVGRCSCCCRRCRGCCVVVVDDCCVMVRRRQRYVGSMPGYVLDMTRIESPGSKEANDPWKVRASGSSRTVTGRAVSSVQQLTTVCMPLTNKFTFIRIYI